ncbi:MAG: hypothetical protein KJ621_17980 [Proteobacteria bacterium]|nr:hypothetical protein [Pseudomonadota bacterium]MBU1742447.1 hypothetical protein [Pseudomonadota bacterium]
MGELIDFMARVEQVRTAKGAEDLLAKAGQTLSFLFALLTRVRQTFDGISAETVSTGDYRVAVTRLSAIKAELSDLERATSIFLDEVIVLLIEHFKRLAEKIDPAE